MMCENVISDLKHAQANGHKISREIGKEYNIKATPFDLFLLLEISTTRPDPEKLKEKYHDYGVIIDASLMELENDGLIVIGEIIGPTTLGEEVVHRIKEKYC